MKSLLTKMKFYTFAIIAIFISLNIFLFNSFNNFNNSVLRELKDLKAFYQKNNTIKNYPLDTFIIQNGKIIEYSSDKIKNLLDKNMIDNIDDNAYTIFLNNQQGEIYTLNAAIKDNDKIIGFACNTFKDMGIFSNKNLSIIIFANIICLFLGCAILIAFKKFVNTAKKECDENISIEQEKHKSITKEMLNKCDKVEQEKHKLIQKHEEDIKRMEKLEKELSHDNLTGLLNKSMLTKELQNSKNAKLLLIDVDEFRKINNFFSHEAGDKVLCDIAEKLKKYAQENNMKVFNINGDLFALYEDVIELDDKYLEMIEEIKSLLESEPYNIDKTDTNILLSFTIGLCLENDDCLKKAMIALKKAKKTSKSFMSYTQNITNKESYKRQIATANIIKDALEKNQVIPFYQPIFNREQKIIKYEALVRIVKQDLEGKEEVISPIDFLQTSVKLKHYSDIQQLMFKNISQKILENPEIQIAINMSARDMNDATNNDFVLNIIKQYNIANNLVFEMLENEDVSKNPRIIDFLKKARRLGCKIAIDDFGTGYSNFSYLLEFSPDYIKIDGSLIKDMDTNPQNYNIVKLIVAFAKNANMKVVAEFVHSKTIYDMCMEIGIDEFQGFYLGQPKRDLVHN